MAEVLSTLEADLERAGAIDGWLTRPEMAALYGLAYNADAPIVEIGSFQGRSTACLALGSMAGRKQPVYAIDPFIGPQKHAYRTTLGNPGNSVPCSPALLRANLDGCGINGQVRVVPKRSEEALEDVPEEIAVLFVDGCHEYEAVCRDIDNYLPRVKMGGFVVFHDVKHTDMGVVRAVEDRVKSRPLEWRVMAQVESALVVRRVKTERRNVVLMCPGRGYDWGPLVGIVQATLGANVIHLDNNGNGWDDFNALWSRALNRVEDGEVTHAAMLHSDIVPQAGFVDLLLDELDELGLDFLSVACAMKDRRGLLNCGIGITANRWGAWRRLTVRELLKLPPTFGLDDLKQRGFCTGDDKVLLHNTGCFIADLRRPLFREVDERGRLRAWFDFPTGIQRDPKCGNKWVNMRESEDWFFSRQLHEIGAKTRITRKVTLSHQGIGDYPNNSEWGVFESDTDTEPNWNPEGVKK